MSIIGAILIIVACLAASAFFSGSETALFRLRRHDLDGEEQRILEEMAQVPIEEQYFLVQHLFPHFFAPKPDNTLSNIGRVAFETDRIPEGWVEKCNAMGEIWVPTDFNVETFSRSGVESHKIFKIPQSIDVDQFGQHVDPLTLPLQKGFSFLSVFDLSPRKG